MSSMSKIEINDELIARYLTGDAEPEEAMALADWLRIQDNREHFEELEMVWRKAAAMPKPEFGKAGAWQRVSATVHMPVATPVATRKFSLWPVGIAAAVLVLAASAYFLVNIQPSQPAPAMGTAATSDSFRFVELPDRSTVTLHRNSELQYPDQFARDSRHVQLTRGEAFFNVTSDASRPFVVVAGSVEIKVLGTEFNVQVQDSVVTIHVREGRVLVTSDLDSLTLTTGFTGRVRLGHITATDVPVGNLYSYATQRLVFDDAPLSEVIHDLEDSYPNTFELKNESLKNCRLTANFYKDDIDKIVNLIAETLNLSVAKNGRNFTLEGEGCR